MNVVSDHLIELDTQLLTKMCYAAPPRNLVVHQLVSDIGPHHPEIGVCRTSIPMVLRLRTEVFGNANQMLRVVECVMKRMTLHQVDLLAVDVSRGSDPGRCGWCGSRASKTPALSTRIGSRGGGVVVLRLVP